MLRFVPGIDDHHFQNEFENLKRLKHENIVRLLGFCLESEERVALHEGKLVQCEEIHRALILEYMPNGSLGKFLSDGYVMKNWPIRYRIIKGICEGLKYLHEGLEVPIMHFDLKPDNILLDQEMVPKIADFGLSRLIGEGNTKMTLSPLGTLGYLPPEFINSGIISKEYDIYSLGVIITKIVVGLDGYTGIPDRDAPEFIEHVQKYWKRSLEEIPNYASVEPDCKQVRACIEIAVKCMDKDRHRRPRIKDIVSKLDDIGYFSSQQQHLATTSAVSNIQWMHTLQKTSAEVLPPQHDQQYWMELYSNNSKLDAIEYISSQQQYLGTTPDVSNTQQQNREEVMQAQHDQKNRMVLMQCQSRQNQIHQSQHHIMSQFHSEPKFQQLLWMLQQPLFQQKILNFASTLIQQDNIDPQMSYIQAQRGLQEFPSSSLSGVNNNMKNLSLTKRDRNSDNDDCSQILFGHSNEVWIVMFSHNGNYLASASSDCTAIIWKVEKNDTLTKKCCLEGHQSPISLVAWSPNDKMLLTYGIRESMRLWNIYTNECNLNLRGSVDHTISACAWFPNSEKIVCSSFGTGSSPNRIFTCNLEGQELEVWERDSKSTVWDLSVTPDDKHLISVSSNEIWIRELSSGCEWKIQEEQSISSLSLSSDGQLIIVNLNHQEIHLWNVDRSSTIPEKFKGHKQKNFVIRSCFGGSDSLYIASGSEDSKVYIWRRDSQTPIKVLHGHSMIVNCVSWNPIKPHMLASASDDRTVRVWLLADTPLAEVL